jgi:hypothetical protein
MYTLAKKIANFVWDLDPYEARDNYENIGELISETLKTLADKTKRTVIVDYLYECETETEYAMELAREVIAL